MANRYSGKATAGEMVALPQALIDVYSMDIMHEAQGIMMYEEFAVKKTDLSATPGDTIQITTYDDITRGAALTESTAMETKNMSAAQIPIVVGEYGNAIGVTERLLQTSFDDLMAEASLLLGRDYALVRDLAIRDALVAAVGPTVLYTTPGAAAVGDVEATDYMDIETIRLAVEALQTANAPKFMNDFYVCFVHPHQAAYIKRDPDWIAAQNYANTRKLFNGELGRWEDVVFIVTTHQGNGAAAATAPGYEAALDATGKAGQDLYRATIFGDQAYGVADALPVEMRDNGVQDFGRKHGLAWYAIWGQKVLKTDYLLHIISS